MTVLNVVSILVFAVLVVGLALAYRAMRVQVRDAEGFVAVRDESEVAATPLVDSNAEAESDVVVVLG